MHQDEYELKETIRMISTGFIPTFSTRNMLKNQESRAEVKWQRGVECRNF